MRVETPVHRAVEGGGGVYHPWIHRAVTEGEPLWGWVLACRDAACALGSGHMADRLLVYANRRTGCLVVAVWTDGLPVDTGKPGAVSTLEGVEPGQPLPSPEYIAKRMRPAQAEAREMLRRVHEVENAKRRAADLDRETKAQYVKWQRKWEGEGAARLTEISPWSVQGAAGLEERLLN